VLQAVRAPATTVLLVFPLVDGGTNGGRWEYATYSSSVGYDAVSCAAV
jgi:hypothetical protein